MESLSTVSLLYKWARWGEGQSIDYPSISPMFGESALRTPLYGTGYCDPEVFHVEQIICKLEFDDRDCLIQRFQRRRTWEQMGTRFGVNWRTAKKRTGTAVGEVHRRLCENIANDVGTMITSCQAL